MTIARPGAVSGPPARCLVERPYDTADRAAEWSGAGAAMAALAMIGAAAAVAGRRGVLLAANDLFESRLAGLGVRTPGGLRLTDALADRSLASTLAEPTAEEARARSVLLPRRGARPMVLHVVPVPGAVRDLLPGAVAMLVLVEPGGHRAADAGLIQHVLDLTPAEARLTGTLAGGGSLALAAARARITIETARTHLKHIYAKTGVTRQAELVALLAGVRMPMGPGAV